MSDIGTTNLENHSLGILQGAAPLEQVSYISHISQRRMSNNFIYMILYIMEVVS
jgi:hypothetical protein